MKPYLNFLYALTGIAFSAASFAASRAASRQLPHPAGRRRRGRLRQDQAQPAARRRGRAAAAATTQHHHQLRPAGDGRAAPIRRRWQRQSPGQQPARRDAAGQPGPAWRPAGTWARSCCAGGAIPPRWTARRARLIVSSDGGATWRELDADAAPDANDLIAWTRDAQRRPSSGRTLTVGVRIEAAIAPTSTLYLGREVQLDGAIDLSAVFL